MISTFLSILCKFDLFLLRANNHWHYILEKTDNKRNLYICFRHIAYVAQIFTYYRFVYYGNIHA